MNFGIQIAAAQQQAEIINQCLATGSAVGLDHDFLIAHIEMLRGIIEAIKEEAYA